jgi:hypothetical protein
MNRAASAVDLTFASAFPRIVMANVKSEAVLDHMFVGVRVAVRG